MSHPYGGFYLFSCFIFVLFKFLMFLTSSLITLIFLFHFFFTVCAFFLLTVEACIFFFLFCHLIFCVVSLRVEILDEGSSMSRTFSRCGGEGGIRESVLF